MMPTVCIMDHDSVSGCEEFLEACKAVDIASTIGFEMRVNMDGTCVEGRKTNNPDEPNISYIAIHGIPRNRLPEVRAFLQPVHENRMARNRLEVKRLNQLLRERGTQTLDFERDVVPESQASQGGSVTERHILFALAKKLVGIYGQGVILLDFIEHRMEIPIAESQRERLLESDNPHFLYDLLGLFKSALVPSFFIHSSHEECPSVFDAVKFARSIDAIPAYAYLGDVADSVTGDKKVEKFEDDYLDELVPELVRIGFQAVTYMPPRNTPAQLLRLQKLCQEYGLMEISGVDINSSRQSFNCPILLEPQYRHLVDAAWALIAHEKLAAAKPSTALFNPDNPLADLPLSERVQRYSELGRRIDYTQPEQAIDLAGGLV
ncbi:PHP domain-containing protein [Pseudomonadota bacterium]